MHEKYVPARQMAERLRGVVEHALGGEDVEALHRQTDLRGWTGVGFDNDVKEATVAVLRELETVLSDWNDEDFAASDALDLVADAADAIEAGSSSVQGEEQK